MDEERNWQDDYKGATFLKITEGLHNLTVKGEPELVDSRYGKDGKQWMFPVNLDGEDGQCALPKSVGKIIRAKYIAQGNWPVKLYFERKGMGSESTSIRVIVDDSN